MMNYKEFSDFQEENTSEKSKIKKNFLKLKNKNKNPKMDQLSKLKDEIEREELRRRLIQKKFSVFTAGASEYE